MPEKEALNIHEAHEHAEMVHSDKTLAPVSVTMAILAVLVAAISLLGHRAHNEVLLAQMLANFQKAELVGKTTEQHANALLIDLIGVLNPQNTAQLIAVKEKASREIEHYAKRQEEVGVEEKRLEVDSHRARRKANRFNLGELFCEMALVMCSITLLARQRTFWYAGIAAGGVGVVLAVSAFWVG